MKSSRLALLAAAQLCCAALVSAPALAVDASTVWSDLWRTPDQQGQALLDAGKPAQAAARFRDPRRRAYADLEAGHNAVAAKLLGPFKDPTSEYNLGNALAKSGLLQGALTAYDAALKQAPTDKDIRHNRDLVERALRHQRQSVGSSSGNPRQGGQGKSSRHSGGGQRSGSGSQRPGGASQRPGARSGQAAGSGKMASNGSQAGAGHSGNAGQQPNSPQASDRSFGRSRDSAAQARRDAAFAAALARAQRKQGEPGGASQAQGAQRNGGTKAPARGRIMTGSTDLPRQKPESERQLALDQWLRQIPDSPAGLLRRKFMIQYMLKHPDASPGELQ